MATYQSRLTQAHDVGRWLAAHYAAKEKRNLLLTIYALQIELDDVLQKVHEAPLGEIRLKWWRDAVDDAHAGKPTPSQPVLEALAQMHQSLKGVPLSWFDSAIAARAEYLYDREFPSFDDLSDWLRRSDGMFAVLAARILDEPTSDAYKDALVDGAVAYSFARNAHWVAPRLASQDRTKALALHRDAARVLRSAPPSLAPALAYYSLTPRLLGSERPPSPIGVRWAVFRAVLTGRV